MSRPKILRVSCLTMLSLMVLPSTWAIADEEGVIEEVLIVGERDKAKRIPGGAHHIDSASLERLGHTDIQRILGQVPGISVQVEDGYGLRPNLGIRGVATERSARITLLEDNVLIAPAPYSAPSAYYFPTMGRMAGVEVLTGPAAITQGPYTIGGALNMLSTPIPAERGGSALLETGKDNTWRLHAHYGFRSNAGFGVMLETHQWRSDGYQNVDRGGDSGLDISDYTLKLSYAPDGSDYAIEFKYQGAVQESDQSYLGLTDADFADDPVRRYGISALDTIETDHSQVILRYRWNPKSSFGFSLTFYDNRHERDWFKTEGIDFDGSDSAESLTRTSWSSVVQAVNLGQCIADMDPQALQAILDGTLDTPMGSIQIRSNAREYLSRGIQGEVEKELVTGQASHRLRIGLRIHEDEEDRLQRNSSYSQRSGSLVLDERGLLGNAGNRLQTAEALAAYVYDEIDWGNWRITPGVRYEDIDQDRTRWEIRNARTLDPASRSMDNLRSQRANKTQVWLPGIGVVYQSSDRLSLFAGIHKGFTAPSNSPGVRQEEALNFEAGARFDSGSLRAEVAWFLSDYDNLLGVCTASSGTDCTVGDAFNGDAARVAGIEFHLVTDLSSSSAFEVPLEFAYTYMDGEFETDIADTAFFGDVSSGDPIPYMPKHRWNLVLGVRQNQWDVYLSANYVDAACTRAACGAFQSTEATFVLDLAASYALNERLGLFARVENFGQELEIVGRQPYGARPNKDRTASFGLRLEL